MNDLYMCFCVQKCPSFHRNVQNAFTMYYFLPSLSFFQFQLSALSFCNLPNQVCIHSHVICQVSMKASPQPKECVSVFGVGGGADLGEAVADTQATMQWAVTKAPWSHWDNQWNKHRPKVVCLLEGVGFHQQRQKYIGENGSSQSALFIIFLAWTFGIRTDLSKALELGSTFGKSAANIWILNLCWWSTLAIIWYKSVVSGKVRKQADCLAYISLSE